MMQLVAAGRGVSALPGWLIEEYSESLALKGLKFGKKGIHKQINLGVRNDDIAVKYIEDFIDIAKSTG